MRPLDPRLLRHARGARALVVACAVLGVLTAGLVLTQAETLAAVISRAFLDGAGISAVAVPLGALTLVVLARAPGRSPAELATLATRGVDRLDGYFARYLPALLMAAAVPPIHVAMPPIHVAMPPIHIAIPPIRVAMPPTRVGRWRVRWGGGWDWRASPGWARWGAGWRWPRRRHG